MRVWDNRQSKCFAVMAKIRVATLSGAKASRLRCWSLWTRTDDESTSRGKARKGSGDTCLCTFYRFGGCGHHHKYRVLHGCSEGIRQRVFERLEPCAVKVARTVLRGGSDGNITSLPDLGGAIHYKSFLPISLTKITNKTKERHK